MLVICRRCNRYVYRTDDYRSVKLCVGSVQSIVDKLQSPGAFAHSIEELVIALQRTNDPGRLSQLRPHLDLLAHIDPNPGNGPLFDILLFFKDFLMEMNQLFNNILN